MWRSQLAGIYVGTYSPGLKPFIEDWAISCIEGSPSDFLTACTDFAAAHPSSPGPALGADRLALRVADMGRDSQGELVNAPGQVLEVVVPESDYKSVSHAGHLMLARERSASFRRLERDPREFFLGHRVLLSEIDNELPIERDHFGAYRAAIRERLKDKFPQILSLPSRPGAGGSTAIMRLACEVAFDWNVPTLIVRRGGSIAFEAIERLDSVAGRSLLVVADPEDVGRGRSCKASSLGARRPDTRFCF